MRRRRFLAGTGLVLAGTVAGCSGENGSSGPTDAVESYFDALSDGDREAANRFAHPDGDFYIDEERFVAARTGTCSTGL